MHDCMKCWLEIDIDAECPSTSDNVNRGNRHEESESPRCNKTGRDCSSSTTNRFQKALVYTYRRDISS